MAERLLALRAPLITLVAVFLLAVVLFALAGANPFEAMGLIVEGSVGSTRKLADTLMAWVPLALASVALLVTFSAGLWNIGIEGQIVLGAIGATAVARVMPGPTWIVLTVALLAAVALGVAWGLLVGVLRVKGGVNEIFGGLGLDFVATGLVLYLILGPWARAGIASTSGTDPFPDAAWLPTIGGLRLSPPAVIAALLIAFGIWWLLSRTILGLRLQAVGASPAASTRLGIAVDRHLLLAFAICGAVAGVAGMVQATGFHHKLVPSISGGYGFLAILVVLLARRRVIPALLIAFAFAALNVGSSQLQLRLDLDASVAGVLQGVAVLVALILSGLQRRDDLVPIPDVEG